MSNAGTKEQAHGLIDLMHPEQVSVAVELLERLLDPVSLAQANASFEDEQIGEKEQLSVAAARLETSLPSTQSHEEFIAEFGLSPADWERLGSEAFDHAEGHQQ
jgi:hypothetical protein